MLAIELMLGRIEELSAVSFWMHNVPAESIVNNDISTLAVAPFIFHLTRFSIGWNINWVDITKSSQVLTMWTWNLFIFSYLYFT
jgi:hypothetical protein